MNGGNSAGSNITKSNHIYGNKHLPLKTVDDFHFSLNNFVQGKIGAVKIDLTKYPVIAYSLIHDSEKDNAMKRLDVIKELYLQAYELLKNPALHPEKWFTDKGTFVPHECAVDYISVFSHVITENIGGEGSASQFLGDHWLKDADGVIKTTLENEGKLTPGQIKQALESICNLTRVVDPKKIGRPLDVVMPLPTHTIPIDDGLFNLLSKKIEPHSPKFFYTECLPRKYIPGAIPQTFIDFLDKMLQGDPDAALKKTQIFETIAWTLMKNYDIQGTVIFYGQGGEGKSIIHTLIGLLLVRVTSVTLEELEDDKFKRAELYGSWANLISESTTEIITSEWFKRLTDGTQITVDRKQGHPFQMVSHAKMIIDTNELPTKENELRAFYRRVIAIIDFPNMLEEILTPEQIRDTVEKLKSPDELDKIFSYVVDNFYGPLVQRMKFTGQLNIKIAEEKWEERSNPAAAYIRLKKTAGEILTDVEDVRAMLTQAGADKKKIQRFITRETEGLEEYLTTIKQDVITDAIKWATERGFPAKNINAGSLGKALVFNGYPNLSVNKKIGKGVNAKAWKDIFISIEDETDKVGIGSIGQNGYDQIPLKNGSEIGTDENGIGDPSIREGNGNGSLCPRMREGGDRNVEDNRETLPLPSHDLNRGVSDTEVDFALGNSEKKEVSDDSETSDTSDTDQLLPNRDQLSTEPSNSDVHEQKEDVSRKMEHEDQFPITLEAGELIRVQLSNLGYLVDPNSGITIDSRHYKIGIHGISKLADGKKLNLFKTMSKEHFTQRNDGALGVTWFSRPLVRDDT